MQPAPPVADKRQKSETRDEKGRFLKQRPKIDENSVFNMDEHIDALEGRELNQCLSKRTYAFFRERAALAKSLAALASKADDSKD